MYHVVTDAAQESSSHYPQATGSHYDLRCIPTLRGLHYRLTSIAKLKVHAARNIILEHLTLIIIDELFAFFFSALETLLGSFSYKGENFATWELDLEGIGPMHKTIIVYQREAYHWKHWGLVATRCNVSLAQYSLLCGRGLHTLEIETNGSRIR